MEGKTCDVGVQRSPPRCFTLPWATSATVMRPRKTFGRSGAWCAASEFLVIDAGLTACLQIYELLAGEELFKEYCPVLEAFEDSYLYRQIADITEAEDGILGSHCPPRPSNLAHVNSSTELDMYLEKEPTLREKFAAHDFIPRDEVDSAVAFMKRCLNVVPAKRATVRELLTDPWLVVGGAEERRSRNEAGR